MCVVTDHWEIERCHLYELLCDDGERDWSLICPTEYWERDPYQPLPVR